MDILANSTEIIRIGRLGENEATRVLFDVSEYLNDYPGATIRLLNQLPTIEASYPVANIEIIGDVLYWTVESQDLTKKGIGRCELVVEKDGVVVKSDLFMTEVLIALDDNGNAPNPWQSWLTQFEEYAETAESAAESAAASAEAAAEHNMGVSVNGTTIVFASQS